MRGPVIIEEARPQGPRLLDRNDFEAARTIVDEMHVSSDMVGELTMVMAAAVSAYRVWQEKRPELTWAVFHDAVMPYAAAVVAVLKSTSRIEELSEELSLQKRRQKESVQTMHKAARGLNYLLTGLVIDPP